MLAVNMVYNAKSPPEYDSSGLPNKCQQKDIAMKIVERQALIMNNIEINQRSLDGYVNATAMCQAGGKQLKHFFENKRTVKYIEALSKKVGIPPSLLSEIKEGRNGGTYVHPQLAISLAMWISADFEVAVTNWILNGVIDYAKKEQSHILQLYISEQTRAWEKTFPDVLWEQLGRLDGCDTYLTRRPRWWGKLVKELIYETLDPEVYEYLQNNRPPANVRWHQNLTENVGVKALVSRCYQVAGMATVCRTVDDLRRMVAEHYGKKPAQLNMKLYLV